MKKLIVILVVILVCILAVGGILVYMGSVNEQPQNIKYVQVPTTEGTEAPPTMIEPTETEPQETVIATTTEEASEDTTEPATTEPTTEATTEPTEGDNTLPSVHQEAISGSTTGSGSFATEKDNGLGLIVNWQSFAGSDGKKVRLDISLKCGNLYVGERYNGLTVVLGGQTVSLSTDAIEYTGSSTTILIGSVTMDLPESGADCEVSWAFRGSYNQVKLDTVFARGTIS